MNLSGRHHHFYGAVLLLLGDTLAVHELGGFKVEVGFALRICHHCMATKEMAQSNVKTVRTICYIIYY